MILNISIDIAYDDPPTAEDLLKLINHIKYVYNESSAPPGTERMPWKNFTAVKISRVIEEGGEI